MIQFYAAEVGIDLVFALIDSNGDPVIDAPLDGWPKLFVEGLPASPITLLATTTPGTYHHLIPASQWPVSAGEVIHYYEAYIEFKSSGKTILADEFLIAVIKAPSVSLG